MTKYADGAAERMSASEYRAALGRSKYRAEPTEVDGIPFASKMEARRYRELRLAERAGEICELQLQVRYPITVNGVRVCTYVADFVYTETRTGLFVVEDVKGFRTRVFVLKKQLMQAVYGITIRETRA